MLITFVFSGVCHRLNYMNTKKYTLKIKGELWIISTLPMNYKRFRFIFNGKDLD